MEKLFTPENILTGAALAVLVIFTIYAYINRDPQPERTRDDDDREGRE